MDTGDIAIVATLVIGFIAILVTQFTLMRQANSDLRGEMRQANSELSGEMRQANSEMRAEIREQSDRLGERISDAEREQARLEGANGSLAEVLNRQSHTHDAQHHIHAQPHTHDDSDD